MQIQSIKSPQSVFPSETLPQLVLESQGRILKTGGIASVLFRSDCIGLTGDIGLGMYDGICGGNQARNGSNQGSAPLVNAGCNQSGDK